MKIIITNLREEYKPQIMKFWETENDEKRKYHQNAGLHSLGMIP